MARALIVGCGCRGRELGASLRGTGWQVRGTTRDPGHLGAIETAGIEAAVADPDMVATVFEQVEGVAVVYWLLGWALGEPEVIAAIHGPRLERLLEKLVDTPVRGFVYEAAGRIHSHDRGRGASLVRAAAERWRIPVEIVDADPADLAGWREAMLAATERLVGTAT
jgi:hypothetical protein